MSPANVSKPGYTCCCCTGAGLKIVAFLFFLGVIGATFVSVASTPRAWYHGGVVMAGVMAVIPCFLWFLSTTMCASMCKFYLPVNTRYDRFPLLHLLSPSWHHDPHFFLLSLLDF